MTKELDGTHSLGTMVNTMFQHVWDFFCEISLLKTTDESSPHSTQRHLIQFTIVM